MPPGGTAWPLLVALAAVQPAPSPAPPSTARAVAVALDRALSADDRLAVAALVHFPLELRAGGLHIPVADARALLDLYETVFTPELRAAIARGRSSTASGADLVSLPDGGALLAGAVTILRRGGGFGITAITVPQRTTRAPAAREAPPPRPLTFRVGRPTEVNGTLAAGGQDRYTFFVRAGTRIEARLTGFAGRSALLRLVHASTGRAPDARAGEGVRVWNGQVPEDGTYRLDVTRQPDSGSAPLLYTLSVRLR